MSIQISCDCGNSHTIFNVEETAKIIGCAEITVRGILARLHKEKNGRDWVIPDTWIPELVADFKIWAHRPKIQK